MPQPVLITSVKNLSNHKYGSTTSFVDNFQVNDNFLIKSGFQGHIMHPGPMNIGVEITSNIANSEKSLVLQQVENGLYLRAALLSLIS